MSSIGWTTLSPLPVFLDERERSALADRPATLDGKVLGLFPNWRPSATHILNALGTLLGERYRLASVVVEEPLKEAPAGSAVLEMLQHKLDSLARRVDVVLVGSGD